MKLFITTICCLLFSNIFAAETANNKYNVLFIAVDDLRPDLGCYGVKEAQSPNIDNFAKEAVVFDHHFVQVATCGASRYSMLTGRSPLKTKALGNEVAYGMKLNPNAAQTMPELFKRSGYKTACIGKISHTPDGRVFSYNGQGDGEPELPGAWDELNTPFGSWERGWGVFFAYANGKHREDKKGNRNLSEFVVKEDNELPDGLMAEAAIAQLKKWKNERFFLGLGFFKPHLPFVAPQQDWDAFENSQISLPPFPDKIESSSWHGSNEFYGYKNHFGAKPLDAQATMKTRRAYLACVRYVDRQIGKVLNSLKELELDKNTIVIIWGDHGWNLGDSQIWGKHSTFEEANRSPLIIKVPGIKSQNSTALVESLDIFPTLIELCQPKDKNLNHELDGKSLLPILSQEKSQIRSTAISYWKNKKSIRTPTHRLICNLDGSEPELYKMDTFFTNPALNESQNAKLIEEILQLSK